MKTVVTTTAIDLSGSLQRYLKPAHQLVDTYLEHTNFDIILLTNSTGSFSSIENDRVSIVDYNNFYDETIQSNKRFNMHIKRHAIRLGSQKEYDLVYHHDCDFFITGWDQESFLETVEQDYDVIFPNDSRPQLGGLRQNYKHFQEKIDLEFGDLYYDELDKAPNASETAIIFKNNSKLEVFLDFWDKVAEKNNDFFTYHCAVYFGTAAIHSKMNITHVTPNYKFSTYGRIHHNGRLLNYYGRYI